MSKNQLALMTDSTVIALWSLVIAASALVVSAFVAWWNWHRDIERLRVVAITLGTPSPDPTLHGNFAIEVINLSPFPIQICQVGFKLDSGAEVLLNSPLGQLDERDTWPELAPARIKISLPLGLPSRTSHTFIASTDDFGRILTVNPSIDGKSIQGFVKSGTGAIRYSPRVPA